MRDTDSVSVPDSLYSEMEANKEYEGASTEPRYYDSLSQIEYSQELFFPSKEVSYGILHQGAGKHWRLSENQLQSLLTMLNDSASYAWGELGTPEVHCYFTFYGTNGKCNGITTVDFDGMLYSYPSLYRMKWGAFRDMEKMHRIIDAIKK